MTPADPRSPTILETMSSSEEHTRTIGRDLSQSLFSGAVIALEGDLGAGKTEFVRGFVGECEEGEEVTSPTFALLNTYTCGGRRIHHFDLYRVKSYTELQEMGFDEYLFSGETVLIEWPDRAEGLLPEATIRVVIDHIDATTRRISVYYPGAKA
jgi:tRNA threonylcarbamoyladenosine biosynthesis protein TsaE